MSKKGLINEVRRMQQLAGILKEDVTRFYAPDYVEKKYGKEEAKEIEQNIEDEGNNTWDLYLSLETPEEVEDFIQGFRN